jgi:hypothetical protein
MYKTILLFVLLLAVVFTSSVYADPFSSEWNWGNSKNFGPVKQIEIESNGIKTIEYFNHNRQKTHKEMFGKDGRLMYTTKLHYNQDGNLYKIWFSTLYSNETMWIEIANYKNDGTIEYITNTRGGITNKSKEFIYDTNGLSSIVIDTGSRIVTWKYKFDENKHLTNAELFYNSTLKQSATIANDRWGNNIQIKSKVRGHDIIETNEYIYEKNNNWIEKITKFEKYKNGKLIKSGSIKSKRNIQYYE